MALGKTAKSILISCGSRLAPFDIPQLREVMSYDELELDRIGDRKTAVFFTISDTTPTYNFIVALAFSQMFNLLCERANNVHGGRLPHHVRVLWDEAANTGQVPQLEKLVAVIRSREVSLTLFYQQMAQCKAIYDKHGDDSRQYGQRDLPGRAGKLHHQGNFGKLAGQGHNFHADRGSLPWAVGKL